MKRKHHPTNRLERLRVNAEKKAASQGRGKRRTSTPEIDNGDAPARSVGSTLEGISDRVLAQEQFYSER